MNRWDDEGEEEENDEDSGGRQGFGDAVGAIPFDVPGDEEGHGCGEDPEEQARPGFEADEG